MSSCESEEFSEVESSSGSEDFEFYNDTIKEWESAPRFKGKKMIEFEKQEIDYEDTEGVFRSARRHLTATGRAEKDQLQGFPKEAKSSWVYSDYIKFIESARKMLKTFETSDPSKIQVNELKRLIKRAYDKASGSKILQSQAHIKQELDQLKRDLNYSFAEGCFSFVSHVDSFFGAKFKENFGSEHVVIVLGSKARVNGKVYEAGHVLVVKGDILVKVMNGDAMWLYIIRGLREGRMPVTAYIGQNGLTKTPTKRDRYVGDYVTVFTLNLDGIYNISLLHGHKYYVTAEKQVQLLDKKKDPLVVVRKKPVLGGKDVYYVKTLRGKTKVGIIVPNV